MGMLFFVSVIICLLFLIHIPHADLAIQSNYTRLCICNDNDACMSEIHLTQLWKDPQLAPGTRDLFQTIVMNDTKLGLCKLSHPQHGTCFKSQRVEKSALLPEGWLNNDTHFIETRYGCTSLAETSALTCISHLAKQKYPKAMACCNGQDLLCNYYLQPKFPHHNDSLHALEDVKSRTESPLLEEPSAEEEDVTNTTWRASHTALAVVVALFLFVLSASAVMFIILCHQHGWPCIVYKQNRDRFVHSASYTVAAAGATSIPSRDNDRQVSNQLSSGNAMQRQQHASFSAYSSGSHHPLLGSETNHYSDHPRASSPWDGTQATLGTTPSVHTMHNNNNNNSTGLTSNDVSTACQRTLAQQISLIHCIGRGRFCSVYLGELYGEEVSVRIFDVDYAAEHYWSRELEVCRSAQLTHENVLHLLGADSLLWPEDQTYRHIFIRPYLPAGNLQEFLSKSSKDLTFTWTSLLCLLHSIVSGLAYLHSDISGTRGKPAVAHRDLTFDSVYVNVRHEGEAHISAAIGDFGFSIVYPIHEPQSECSPNGYLSVMTSQTMSATSSMMTDFMSLPSTTSISAHAGLPALSSSPPWLPLPGGLLCSNSEYCAPEILQEELQVNLFDSILQADLYALGVILWKITRWWIYKEQSHLPHMWTREPGQSLPPLLQDGMAVESLSQGERMDQVLKLNELLEECSRHKAEQRLPALRVKKTIASLMHNCD